MVHLEEILEKTQAGLYVVSWKDLNESNSSRISIEEFIKRGFIDMKESSPYVWPTSNSQQTVRTTTRLTPLSFLVKDLLISNGLIYSDTNALEPTPPNDNLITEDYDHSQWRVRE